MTLSRHRRRPGSRLPALAAVAQAAGADPAPAARRRHPALAAAGVDPAQVGGPGPARRPGGRSGRAVVNSSGNVSITVFNNLSENSFPGLLFIWLPVERIRPGPGGRRRLPAPAAVFRSGDRPQVDRPGFRRAVIMLPENGNRREKSFQKNFSTFPALFFKPSGGFLPCPPEIFFGIFSPKQGQKRLPAVEK